jgi:hypothetical protein
MEIVRVPQGKTIIRRGEPLKALLVLVKGSVKAKYLSDEWMVELGSIIGLPSLNSESYQCSYLAESDCMLYAYGYSKVSDFKAIFEMDDKYVNVFTMTALKQAAFFLKRFRENYRFVQKFHYFLNSNYQEYEKACEDYHIPIKKINAIANMKLGSNELPIESSMVDFYIKMSEIPLETLQTFIGQKFSIGIGEIVNAASWMEKALGQIEVLKNELETLKKLLLGERDDNLFQRCLALMKQAYHEGMDIDGLQDIMTKIIEFAQNSNMYQEEMLMAIIEKYEASDFMETQPMGTGIWDEDAFGTTDIASSSESVTQILRFANYDEVKAKEFQEQIFAFKSLPDLLSTSEEAHRIREKVTRGFYDLYKAVFFHTMECFSIPPMIKMFLNFGFVEEELVSEEVSDSLYDLTDELYLCKSEHVYTIYEWLRSIYEGENEPSRGELGLDYQSIRKQQQEAGKISAKQLAMDLIDGRKKAEFELDNMFATANRATYGKKNVYCPLLSGYDLINSVENMIVTAEKVAQSLEIIQKIDFSVFYQKVIFSSPEYGIFRERMQQHVPPIIILLPNAGSQALMWQESEKEQEITPARFLFPILTVADVTEMLSETIGRYRWEICKKQQGIYWNDLAKPSLTSEYSDYLQYYRSNPELSADAKEKVKNALYKTKNNYRELFAKEYHNWIKYESKGQQRLNPIVRQLMFRYCPFTQEIREKLKKTPIYQELIEEFYKNTAAAVQKATAWYKSYLRNGGTMTKEMEENSKFYKL